MRLRFDKFADVRYLHSWRVAQWQRVAEALRRHNRVAQKRKGVSEAGRGCRVELAAR